MLQQLSIAVGAAPEAVLNAHKGHGNGRRSKGLSHRSAQPTDDAMLLGGDHPSATRRQLADGLVVEGLQGTLTTFTSALSSTCSAAWSARDTMYPVANTVTSFPSRNTVGWPMTKGASSAVTLS